MAIAPISHVSGIALPEAARSGPQTNPGAFQEAFASAIRTVESIGNGAGQTVEKFLAGEGEELHTTIMATQRAELSFELFMQVRNKVVSAYQEIMRMQV